MKHTPSVAVLMMLTLAGCSEFELAVREDVVEPGTCPVDIPVTESLPVDESCGAIPYVSDPWQMAEEWHYFGGGDGSLNSSYAPPLVARLTDTNDDGVVDELDHPNIVLVTFPSVWGETIEGNLVVIDGVTRAKVWEFPGVYYGTGHAIADVTGDGMPNVVVFDGGRRAMLLDASGELVWTSTVSADGLYPQSTIADLDGDGRPEVIADSWILDGRTGEAKGELVARSNIPYTLPAVGDIDLDGHQEIVYGNTVHRSDGTPWWTTNVAGDYGHFSAILNVDDDPEGEVAMVGASRLLFFDTDGTELHRHDLPRRAGSAPCVADFDGDGQSEIAFGLTDGAWGPQSLFRAYEIDGTLMWSREVEDMSGIAGCSGYDFDGDGAVEILYADEVELFVFDGATGEVRWSTTEHASGTVYEYPVIADVDMDGAAELLSVRSGDPAFPVLTVIGHDGPGWAPSGQTWPLHDFAVTNVTPEGGVPVAPPAYWVEHNTYRARPVVDGAPIDFGVEVVDVCVEGCDDDALIRVAVQVVNTGPQLVPAGVGVTLWGVNAYSSTAIDTVFLGAQQPGAVHHVVFETTVGELGPAQVMARVDDIGTGAGFWPECDEDNNAHTWGPASCLVR